MLFYICSFDTLFSAVYRDYAAVLWQRVVVLTQYLNAAKRYVEL